MYAISFDKTVGMPSHWIKQWADSIFAFDISFSDLAELYFYATDILLPLLTDDDVHIIFAPHIYNNKCLFDEHRPQLTHLTVCVMVFKQE